MQNMPIITTKFRFIRAQIALVQRNSFRIRNFPNYSFPNYPRKFVWKMQFSARELEILSEIRISEITASELTALDCTSIGQVRILIDLIDKGALRAMAKM